MPWKFNGDVIVVENGNPVWISSDKKESPMDGDAIMKKVSDVTGESMARKSTIRELTEKLAPFENIDNPVEFISNANKAIATVQGLDENQLVDAAKVTELTTGFQTQLSEAKKAHTIEVDSYKQKLADKDAAIHAKAVRSFFDQSDYLSKMTVLTPEFAYSHFKDSFKVDDKNEFYAIDNDGKTIYSSDASKAGSVAGPEEAIEMLINAHPDKDKLLVATDQGSNFRRGQGNPNIDLSKLSPIERMNAARQTT